MNEQQPPAETTKPDTKQREGGIGRKAWIAIIAAVVVLGPAIWIVTGALTAKPSQDPNAHEDFVAIANVLQPDPNAPSQYAELAEALLRYQTEFELIEQEFAHDRSTSGSGVKFLEFYSVLKEPDPTGPESYAYEEHVRSAQDSRRAAVTILEQNIFSEVAALLRSPNLARTLEDIQNGPMYEYDMYTWYFTETMALRKFAHTAIGCARVLSERGETQQAAVLLEDIAPIPAVLTRQTLIQDHITSIIITNWVVQEVEHILSHSRPNAETLKSLRSVHSHLSRTGDLSPVIENERISARQVHYLSHTRDGRFIPSLNPFRDTPMDPENQTVLKLKDSWGFFAVSQRESMEVSDELLSMYLEASRQPDPAERDRLLAEYDEKKDSYGWQYPLIHGYYWPSISRVKWSFEHRARVAALGILLAMAEYRLDNGDWPESLDQLVPSYLDRIPTNPLTGLIFAYDREPGQPPSLERLGAVNSMPEFLY